MGKNATMTEHLHDKRRLNAPLNTPLNTVGEA